MFRPLRQRRFEDLQALGYLRYEAVELSKMPRSIPYLREMVAKRANEHSRYIKSGKTESEWKTHILRRYPMKGYGKAKEAGAVWAMVREVEEPYKKAHPEYVRGYPKKSHHKSGEVTNHKLKNSLGKSDYSQEIKEIEAQIKTFPKDAPIIEHLQNEIERLKREQDR